MTRPLPAYSLLDGGMLPIAELARIAMREGVRPRAVYQAHKWFARRLAVTARALLVAAAAEEGAKFWREFYRGDLWTQRTVLDPFVGGGVMLLEASRLGASVKGVDVEPVAAAIARFQTSLGEVPDLIEPLKDLTETVGKALAPYYEAEDETGARETLLHAFWVQVVQCGGCGHRFHAHPNFRFAWDETLKREWIACARCSRVLKRKLGSAFATCLCGQKTRVDAKRIHRGAVQCPGCGKQEQLIAYARRIKSPPLFELFAVEVLPRDGDSQRHGMEMRRIRSATAFDHDRYRRAELLLKQYLEKNPLALPKGVIPRKRRADNRLVDYGYSNYDQLFNARQLLHVALLGEAIRSLKGSGRNALAMAFSDHLTTNNMMCAYAGGWRRLTPLFSIRAYRHIARPVEINPWLTKNGRGTFPNAVRAIARATKALASPVEPTPNGLLRAVRDARPAFSEIVCGDARRMKHIASGSIDLVLTDPPYFDYISYSELGHFFAPWLSRFGLVPSRKIQGFPLGQLASAARSSDAERRFSERLTAAFKEIRRVCHREGRIVFTYQNLDGRGWQAIAAAMAKAGVLPFRTVPLYGDSSASLHKNPNSISWDCVMVCRLGKPVKKLKIDPVALREGATVAARWSKMFVDKGLPVTEGDRTNITHASAIVAAFSAQRFANSARGSLLQEAS